MSFFMFKFKSAGNRWVWCLQKSSDYRSAGGHSYL